MKTITYEVQACRAHQAVVLVNGVEGLMRTGQSLHAGAILLTLTNTSKKRTEWRIEGHGLTITGVPRKPGQGFTFRFEEETDA